MTLCMWNSNYVQRWLSECDDTRDYGTGWMRIARRDVPQHYAVNVYTLGQGYSTFFVRVPPDIISLQLCTLKVVGV
jgi:hypothetical protein